MLRICLSFDPSGREAVTLTCRGRAARDHRTLLRSPDGACPARTFLRPELGSVRLEQNIALYA